MSTLAKRAELVLGTAQLGMPYGIANRAGKPAEEEVRRMLERAADEGIRALDTAPSYGVAEDLIGRYADPQRLAVITKISDVDAGGSVIRAIRLSLERLRRDRLDTLLVHNAAHLLSAGGKVFWAALLRARTMGLTRRIGVSVYQPETLRRILQNFAIDVVQLPFNVYDTRFASTGLIQEAASRGVEVHARSPFLQGLLLMAADRFPDWLSELQDHQTRFHAWSEAQGLSLVSMALAACHAQRGIAGVVVGCQSRRELDQIIAADRVAVTQGDMGREAIARFGVPDSPLVNPLQWPR